MSQGLSLQRVSIVPNLLKVVMVAAVINTDALIHDEVFVKTFFFVFNAMATKLWKDLQMSLGNDMN